MAGRLAVGLDIGGTKVAGMLVRDDGTVVQQTVEQTPAADVDATLETAYEIFAELAHAGEPEAVGVGAAGMVEYETGIIRSTPNLMWRDDFPIRDLVAERIGLPCVVENDANAAAWAEYLFGAGAGYGHVLTITVGTGIGGAVIAGGALYRGAHGFAAEIGHFIVEPGGPRCGCGNLGCWEQVASGRALDRLGREEAARDPSSRIAQIAGEDEVNGMHIGRAAAEGDARAQQIIAEVGRRLGEGLAGLVNILDPEIIVVGGGVAEIGEPLLGPAGRSFLEAVEAPAHRPEIPIVPAKMGNDAGGIGAAMLALQSLQGPA